MDAQIVNRITELGGTHSINHVYMAQDICSIRFPKEEYLLAGFMPSQTDLTKQLLYSRKDIPQSEIVGRRIKWKPRHHTANLPGTCDYKKYANCIDYEAFYNATGTEPAILLIAHSSNNTEHYFVCIHDQNPHNPRVYATNSDIYFTKIRYIGKLSEFLNLMLTDAEYQAELDAYYQYISREPQTPQKQPTKEAIDPILNLKEQPQYHAVGLGQYKTVDQLYQDAELSSHFRKYQRLDDPSQWIAYYADPSGVNITFLHYGDFTETVAYLSLDGTPGYSGLGYSCYPGMVDMRILEEATGQWQYLGDGEPTAEELALIKPDEYHQKAGFVTTVDNPRFFESTEADSEEAFYCDDIRLGAIAFEMKWFASEDQTPDEADLPFMSPSSFQLSFGADPRSATPYCTISGEILSVQKIRNDLTNKYWYKVQLGGFLEVTLALPGDYPHPLEPGNYLSGSAMMVASVGDWPEF